MAYVESFYLEPEVTPFEKNLENSEEEPVDVVIPAATVSHAVSDYCGFESDEIPPIYRAQLRAAQKNKILEAENADKSMYAYGNSEIEQKVENAGSKGNESTVPQSIEFYVPGFSAPPQSPSDEIQKRNDFSLPKNHSVEATENIFYIAGKHEASQYVLMDHENPKIVNQPKQSQMESLISYTASDVTSSIATGSCVTATLGPAYGCISAEIEKSRPSNEKYKGLSAFRPVTRSIDSTYAMPELN